MKTEVIDISCLSQKEAYTGEEAQIYHDEKTAYKIFFPHTNFLTLNNKQKKIKFLKDLDISEVVTPKTMLVKQTDFGKVFTGYTMDYIEAENLVNFDGTNKEFLILLERISQILRQIHESPLKICISDFHFNNIMFSKDLTPYFIDCDSWKVKNLESEGYACSYELFCESKGIMKLNQNADIIMFYLCIYQTIFDKYFSEISRYEYDELSEQNPFLKETKEIFNKLIKSKGIPNVPYPDEFINSKVLAKTI